MSNAKEDVNKELIEIRDKKYLEVLEAIKNLVIKVDGFVNFSLEEVDTTSEMLDSIEHMTDMICDNLMNSYPVNMMLLSKAHQVKGKLSRLINSKVY